MHQRLLHFAVDSKWSDRAVRHVAAQYALKAMTRREPVDVWIVDDTGFLKQGKHSVGVQRARHFPPRPEGRLKPTRSRSRPERHFPDSFITARLAIARRVASWLPRCPTCYRTNHRRSSRDLPGLPAHPSGP
jgi:hypothetical protein